MSHWPSDSTVRSALFGACVWMVLPGWAVSAEPAATDVLQVVETAPADTSSAYPPSSDAELMVQQLQEEVRDLRGQVEALQFRLDQMNKQARQRYIDLDQRLLELAKQLTRSGNAEGGQAPQSGVSSTAGAAVPPPALTGVKPTQPPPSSPAVPAPVSAEQQRRYQAAFEKVRQQKFKEAIGAFLDFVRDYPDSDLTANAYYWLGEVYLVENELEKAKQAFIVVLGNYPKHRKAADARFKLGVTYHRLGQTAEARKMLEQTLTDFPDSHAAELARAYLKKLGTQG